MISLDYSLIIVILNFILLLIFLKKLLYAPIVNFLTERQNQINKDLDDAKTSKEKAELFLNETDEKLKNAHVESRKILDLAEKKATKEAHDIVENAKERELKIIEETKVQIQLEEDKIKSNLKFELADMITNISEKLIDSKMDSKKDKEFIDKALQNRGVK